MAKKRLNKKVALIGSLVFIFLMMTAIAVVLHLSRDAHKFLTDGDVALQNARHESDEDLKAEIYQLAERNYHKARSYSKTDLLRVKVLFKLAELYKETEKWRNVISCWSRIIQIERDNAEARFARLKYVYIAADSGTGQLWREVELQASEFIELAQKNDLFDEATAKWDPFKDERWGKTSGTLGPFLYLLRGRANMELTKAGAMVDNEKTIDLAIADLEKVRDFEPEDVDIYWYLAEAIRTKSGILVSRGDFQQRDAAIQQTRELLEKAVEIAPDEPQAYHNLLSFKLVLALQEDEQQIEALKSDYLSLTEKFPAAPGAFMALAEYYDGINSMGRFEEENLDNAIKAIQMARQLDSENVNYAIGAATLLYRKFSVYGDNSQLYEAIEIAENALAFPDAQDKPGPRRNIARVNRIGLLAFLANCYTEQLIEPHQLLTEPQRLEFLEKAESKVHDIEQFLGSGENPQVIKWRAILELAKGNDKIALEKLYATYERLKASGRRDMLIAYRLAEISKDTVEVGATAEFYASAMSVSNRAFADKIDEVKPETILDYADVQLKLRDHTGVLNLVDFFEERYWTDSRSQILRINADIGAGQFEQAQENLSAAQLGQADAIKLKIDLTQAELGRIQRSIARKMEESDTVMDKLKAMQQKYKTAERPLEDTQAPPVGQQEDITEYDAELETMTGILNNYKADLAESAEKLSLIEPNSLQSFVLVAVCNNAETEGDIEQARGIVSNYLRRLPDNPTALYYKHLLSETDWKELSSDRRRQIREQALMDITDPSERAMNLGVIYRTNNEPDKAIAEFKKVFNPDEQSVSSEHSQPGDVHAEQLTQRQRIACEYLFGTALDTENYTLAEQLAGIAADRDIDGCEGLFFASRIAVARQKYTEALTALKRSLEKRPLFSHAYMLRSRVNSAVGDEDAAIKDAHTASSLNPLDGSIAKRLANVLFTRNKELGDKVSSDEHIELKQALLKAMRINRNDPQLTSLYAECISQENPADALAMRQRLQKNLPSLENSLLLGAMAMRTVRVEKDNERRDFLLKLADSAFRQAYQYDPNNERVLASLSEYYRLTDQQEKAEQLIVRADNRQMLWNYYFRNGQFEQAGKVLEQLYNDDPNNIDTLRGLLMVAEQGKDQDAAKKYSEKLVSIDDDIVNRVIQIRSLLSTGLVKESELELQSLRQEYPNEPQALVLESWLTMRQGRLQEAIKLANQALENKPDSHIIWRLKGQINLLMANYEQATIDLKRSKALLAEPITRFLLARTYVKSQQLGNAVTELKSIIHSPRVARESRQLLEWVYWHLGRNDELMNFYSSVLENSPEDVYWYEQAGNFALAINDLNSAKQLYELAWEKSKEQKQNNSSVFDNYLRMFIDREEYDRVFEEAGKYINSDFAPIAYIRMAEAKLRLEDKQTALRYCRQAIDKAGTNETYLSGILIRAYSLIGQQSVSDYCKQKLQDNPDSLAANHIMFNLTIIEERYNEAIGHIDKCLQIIGPDSELEVHYRLQKANVLNQVYVKTSDKNYIERTIAEYESLLSEMPNNTGVLNNLAYLLAESNENLDRALEYAKRAYEGMPNRADFLDTYGYVLYKNGKHVMAEQFLHSALQRYEQDSIFAPPEVYEHLGMIKEAVGSKKEAVDAYKLALRVSPNSLPELMRQRLEQAVERLEAGEILNGKDK